MNQIRTLSAAAFVLLSLTAMAHLAYRFPQLPHIVASHFRMNGEADGWQPKSMYISGMALLYLMLSSAFPGLGLLLRVAPLRILNLPNKSYWIHPQRQAITRSYLVHSLLWLGSGTLATMLVMNELAIRANLTESPHLGYTPWLVLGMFLTFLGVWLFRLLRRFMQIPPEHAHTHPLLDV